ncbi:carbohydrate ABC transporter permease [Cryobacterium psychrophilum]|uniref:Sugar ABC transporter permease n=1 Tax=Cryobacterium psychrophilum TaxID=41988 RepID=A0A4Y8KPR6_9MICO|nr:sugar ABC transporter permease [Cryobacterium psychrophilum]TDW30456.1 carbohydrate ABC transporter membrane protein 1 (CUT1 family) [Cryobacterium psychrophilum]TFD79533.1 sugar ABC transporter permease [Cryobacterium psychrophilum]
MSAFFAWLAQLPPLAQVPIVIAAFAVVVGAILFFVEIAPRPGKVYTIIRLAVCVLLPLLLLALAGSYPIAIGAAAVLGGVFFLIDYRGRKGAGYLFQLIGFLAPAVLLLAIGLIIPTVQTTVQAFQNSRGTEFVGLENFVWVFTQPNNVRIILNTIVWVLFVPTVSTVAGLAYAVFIDKSRGEKYFKILVFMPMAISLVGASIIWRFIYTARPADQEQIGLLNAIVVGLGGQAVNFLAVSPWNTLFLIVILIWVQTGFAMVVLSAAIKGVPIEQLEAAELDGTNAWQKFTNVTVPGIRSALIVVLTTISIVSLKVFDIVRTTTAGTNDTSVIANEMYTQFKNFEQGRSAAFALILFLLTVPIIVFNARQIKKQREIR